MKIIDEKVSKKALPEFLCIGAQKAGTTWLYSNLRKHPQIWLPPIKENYYFNERESDFKFNILNRILDKKCWYNKKWREDFNSFFSR